MRKLIMVLGAVCGLVACNENTVPPTPVSQQSFTVSATINNAQALQKDSIYKLPNEPYFKVSDFRFYIANLEVKQANGEWLLLKDAFLADVFDAKSKLTITVPKGATAMRFGLGVPKGINTGDPTLFPNSHPFSVAGGAGMHWNWNEGYKFILFEGRYDSIATGQFIPAFALHTGTDTLYRKIEFPITSDALLYHLELDVSKLFTDIDLSKENQTHGSGSLNLATRFTNNFEKALTLIMAVE